MRLKRFAAVILIFAALSGCASIVPGTVARTLLGLAPKTEEFRVVYGSIATDDKEIALLTRSILEILIDLSSYIEVPATSAAERRTFPI